MYAKDDEYHLRCISLALNGLGRVAPNPLVGSVIVYEGKIIGEGFHHSYGKNHAEVNAIASVSKNYIEKLKDSTIYVNLEPCSHFGKTPPCAKLIIEKQIKKVEVATIDPYPDVSGKGIAMLKQANHIVNVGQNASLARFINRRFFTFHEKKRPYIILKWAETADGFIDRLRTNYKLEKPTWITDNFARILVHKWRTEEQAILIGTNTALFDNPNLTARYFYGKNPIRMVIDRTARLPHNLNIFNNASNTIIFTENVCSSSASNVQYVSIHFENLLNEIFKFCFENKIQSIIVEGGTKLLNTFISSNLWDEARVFKGQITFSQGIKAPNFNYIPFHVVKLKNSALYYYFNAEWAEHANIHYL